VPVWVLGDTARQMTGGAEVNVALATTEGGNDGIIGFEGGGRKTTTRPSNTRVRQRPGVTARSVGLASHLEPK
jgi:hypothetical protein